MNLIEQIEWLNAAKRTRFIRVRNWIIHTLVLTIFVSSILVVIMSPHHTIGYLFALLGGYLFALNFYSIKWIINQLRHK